MFATLLGGLPRSPVCVEEAGGIEASVEVAVRAQEAAGLEPLTDGRLRSLDFEALVTWERPITVDAWRATQALTTRAVKQALPGPYTLGRGPGKGASRRRAATLAYAEALRREVEALAAAGCPLVEIEEGAADQIGDDERERRLFREAHRLIADGVTGTHLSLSIVGGSAHTAGAATILDAPYASLAVDLIAGPDNWYLVVAAPPDRGIVAGALSAERGSDDGPELLFWAAHYAASTQARGIVRVGLGTAGGLVRLTWDEAVAKMTGLGEAARIAALPPGEELARLIDPRAIDIRSAALGRRGRRSDPSKEP